MSEYKELLDKLHDRFARGEISEKTFLEVKARYVQRIKAERDREMRSADRGTTAPRATDGAGSRTEVIPPSEGGIPDFEEAMERAARELERKMQEVDEEIKARFEEAAGRMGEAKDAAAGAGANVRGAGVPTTGRNVRVAGLTVHDQVNAQSFSSAGACKIQGDLEAETAGFAGALKVMGNMKVGEGEFSGATKVMGDVSARKIRTSGAFKAMGGANVQDLESSGALAVAGSMEVGRGRSSGALEIGGDLTGDQLIASGKVAIAGKTVLRLFHLRLNGHSTADTIEAAEIKVENPAQGALFHRLFHRGGTLKAKVIRGTSVTLEWTTADVVEGHEVTIGRNCRIGRATAEKLRINETSTVDVKESRRPPRRKV